ncbi:hypothetical protein [Lysobacter tyrosinilyticus]
MKLRFLGLAVSVVALATACNQKPANPEAAKADAPAVAEAQPAAAPVVDRGNVDFVEAPLDGSTNESHGLKAGESISGEFASLREGNVVGVELQVGNYGNSSAGNLKVKLCQADKCADGSADLATSKDNEYFHVALASPLAVAMDKPLTYTVTRESGDNRMAVWSYPASVPTSKLTLVDGNVVPRTLKLGLRYSR